MSSDREFDVRLPAPAGLFGCDKPAVSHMKPGGQTIQYASEIALSYIENLPAGQGVGSVAPAGQ